MAASDFLLPVSFNLACEVGLEESVLLTYLQQRAHHMGSRQMTVTHRELVDMLPFWTAPYIVRLLTTLQVAQRIKFRRTDVGLDLLLEQETTATDRGEAQQPAYNPEPPQGHRDAANQNDAMSKLSRLQAEAVKQGSTTDSAPYAKRTVRDNNEPRTAPVAASNGSGKDRRGLTDFDLYLEAKERNRQPDQWLPEEATFEQIQQAGIERAFAEALLPEFLLRIKEQRKNVRTWNSEFFKYVKRQWQYKQSDRQSHEGTATYTANTKSNREQVSNALTNIHDTDW